MPDFKTVVMDPPWLEVGGGGRGAQNHYSVSKTSDMPNIITSCPYWNQIEKDAHLYMWVTNSFLADGLWLMKQLDFKYMTNIVWIKNRIGIGQYFRGKHELCLFGTRGRGFAVKTETRKITSVINANRTIHSKSLMSLWKWLSREVTVRILKSLLVENVKIGHPGGMKLQLPKMKAKNNSEPTLH